MFFSSWLPWKDIKSMPGELKVETPDLFYQFKVTTIEGDTFDFSSLKGKKVLIVNTASKCGFTPQYKDLQLLHEKYGDKVIVIAFPSNDFMSQEPGSPKEIKEFCNSQYSVTFPIMDKVHVKGAKKHPVYKWLTEKKLNGWNDQEPKWNFSKYLISEDGKLLKYYGSSVSPMSEEVLNEILK